MDFEQLIPKIGQTRVVACPGQFCNAEMNNDIGEVVHVAEDSVTMRMITGRNAGINWKFSAGHTAPMNLFIKGA